MGDETLRGRREPELQAVLLDQGLALLPTEELLAVVGIPFGALHAEVSGPELLCNVGEDVHLKVTAVEYNLAVSLTEDQSPPAVTGEGEIEPGGGRVGSGEFCL